MTAIQTINGAAQGAAEAYRYSNVNRRQNTDSRRMESETSGTVQTVQNEKIQLSTRTSREIGLPQGDLSQLNIRDIASENQSLESNPAGHTRETESITPSAETKTADLSQRAGIMNEFTETTIRETFSFGVQLYAQWLNGDEDTEENRSEFVEIIRPAIKEGYETARAMFGALPQDVEKAFEHTRDQIIGAFEGFVENGTGWTPEELELAQSEEGLTTINEFNTAVQEKADRMLGLLNEAVIEEKPARNNDKAEARGLNKARETDESTPSSDTRVPVMYGLSGSNLSYETAGQVIDFTS